MAQTCIFVSIISQLELINNRVFIKHLTAIDMWIQVRSFYYYTYNNNSICSRVSNVYRKRNSIALSSLYAFPCILFCVYILSTSRDFSSMHSSGNILMQDAFLPARSTYEICVLKINSILTISSCWFYNKYVGGRK